MNCFQTSNSISTFATTSWTTGVISAAVAGGAFQPISVKLSVLYTGETWNLTAETAPFEWPAKSGGVIPASGVLDMSSSGFSATLSAAIRFYVDADADADADAGAEADATRSGNGMALVADVVATGTYGHLGMVSYSSLRLTASLYRDNNTTHGQLGRGGGGGGGGAVPTAQVLLGRKGIAGASNPGVGAAAVAAAAAAAAVTGAAASDTQWVIQGVLDLARKLDDGAQDARQGGC